MSTKKPLSQNGVMILECMDKQTDPGSEGSFLDHMLNIMSVEHQYLQVHTKYQFLALLQKPTYKYVHIATHGVLQGRHKTENSFKGFWLYDGAVGPDEIGEMRGELKGHVVISTACKSGNSRFAITLCTHSGCDTYIAPTENPSFHNAIYFAHVFYHHVFVLREDVRKAMDKYQRRYRNPHQFSLHSKRKHPRLIERLDAMT